MPISAPPRGMGSSLANRQARPLNGIEVREAVEHHVITVTDKLLDNAGVLSNKVIDIAEEVRQTVGAELYKQSRLQKVNVTYPKVGWSIKVRLEKDGDIYGVNGEIELDLERNVRLNIRFGQSGQGVVVGSLDEEKIPTSIPDKDRQSFGLPVEAEFLRPDGTIGKVNIDELKGEKKAARTVDVGRARVQDVTLGDTIKLPSELPEVTFDDTDLVASPPEISKEPIKTPLPPTNSMYKSKRPDVKFKR
jgi:hypothetical protein